MSHSEHVSFKEPIAWSVLNSYHGVFANLAVFRVVTCPAKGAVSGTGK